MYRPQTGDFRDQGPRLGFRHLRRLQQFREAHDVALLLVPHLRLPGRCGRRPIQGDGRIKLCCQSTDPGGQVIPALWHSARSLVCERFGVWVYDNYLTTI